MAFACCDTWAEQSNSCIVADACPSRISVAISFDHDGGTCAIGESPCLVTALPTCCLVDCRLDPARCVIGGSPEPLPSCCYGYCSINVDLDAWVDPQCLSTPLATLSGCCDRAAATATLFGLPPAPTEWTIRFGRELVVADASESGVAPPDLDATPPDADESAPRPTATINAPTQGGGCSVSRGASAGTPFTLALLLAILLVRKKGLAMRLSRFVIQMMLLILFLVVAAVLFSREVFAQSCSPCSGQNCDWQVEYCFDGTISSQFCSCASGTAECKMVFGSGVCCEPQRKINCACGEYVDNCGTEVFCTGICAAGLVCSVANECVTPDANLGRDSAVAKPAPAMPRGFALGLAGLFAIVGLVAVRRRQ